MWPSVVAGAGSGLLLGVLVGLSATPLVSVVVGTLLGLVGAFLGYKNADGGDAVTPVVAAARQAGVGAFGFLCVAGVVAGVWLRAHDVLAASPKEQVTRWTDASFDKSVAQAIVAYQAAGIVPPNTKVEKPVEPSHSGLLFAADVNLCDQLDPSTLGDAGSLRILYTQADGAWKRFAIELDSISDTASRVRAFKAGWRLVCGR